MALTAEKKIQHATSALVIQQPFWASLLLRVDVEERSDEWFLQHGAPTPTMATDGRSIYYAASFVDTLSVAEVAGVLSHEVGHNLLLHPMRAGQRDRTIANIAMDLVVNPIIIDSGLKLPGDCLMPGKDGFPAEWKDWNFERVYAEIYKKAKKITVQLGYDDGKGNQGKQPKGAFGGVLPTPEMDKNGKADGIPLEQQWQMAAEQALQAAKNAGKLPGSLERLISANRKPKVDWREQLKRFFEALMPKDYQWSPPNRRFIHQGLYFPSTLKESCGCLVFAIDVSGSVTQEQLNQFASEIQCVADELNPSEIHVVYCDTRITGEELFQQGDPIVLKTQAGGGTSCAPPFRWVEKKALKPKCLIYLTDLYNSDWPKKEPDYPTLWVVYGGEKGSVAPFGETIHIED